MGNTILVTGKQALQHILAQNDAVLAGNEIIIAQGNVMSIKLDQITAVLTDIGTNFTKFVATSQKAAADARALTDAQAAQITLLSGEVAADQTAIKAGQDKIDALTAAATASAAEESSAEDKVLVAAATLDSTVQALNAPPVPDSGAPQAIPSAPEGPATPSTATTTGGASPA
jgi:hypothetical protein